MLAASTMTVRGIMNCSASNSAANVANADEL